MDRMKCQELALVRMVKMGELAKKEIFGRTIWQSMPEKKKEKKRKVMPQMELQQGFD